MRKPAALAAAGIASPSAQEAWCGSPQAICTTSRPSRPIRRFSSGTLVTCNDQLHTPIASGSTAMTLPSGAGRRFDRAGHRPEILLVALADLVEGLHLLGLQLRDLLRAGPNDRPAAG